MLLLAPLYIVGAAVIGYLGRDHKFGFWGYFMASLLLSWPIGLLLVLASDRRARATPPAGTGKSSD